MKEWKEMLGPRAWLKNLSYVGYCHMSVEGSMITTYFDKVDDSLRERGGGSPKNATW